MKKKIGAGAFSSVHLAKSKLSGIEYAVKMIEVEKLKEENKKLIQNETLIMKILNHENIIKFHEAFFTFDYQIYVIELVKGHDLFSHVKEKDVLEEVEVSFIIEKILSTLNYLQLTGLVHRDLKPENIMIIYDERNKKRATNVKLIDFGFAAYLEDLKALYNTDNKKKDIMDAEINKQDCICGTLFYIAPEVFLFHEYSFLTYIFSLGGIMYFMITGNLPFEHEIPDIIINNIIHGNLLTENEERFMRASPQAKDLMMKMLESDPKKRITVKEAMEHPFIKDPIALEDYKQNLKEESFDFKGLGNYK